MSFMSLFVLILVILLSTRAISALVVPPRGGNYVCMLCRVEIREGSGNSGGKRGMMVFLLESDPEFQLGGQLGV